MSNRAITLILHHRLLHDDLFKHLQPTPLFFPEYSAPALPFRWVSRESAKELSDKWGTGYQEEAEPKEGWMERGSWVLNPENQSRQLESFFSAIRPTESLCFFYAKEIPGIAEGRRIIVGVGRVADKLPARKFEKVGSEGYDAWVWERAIQHTIRPGFADGFLFPLHDLLKKASDEKDFTIDEYVAFAPDEYREQFSYVSEHVTSDVALQTLDSCRIALERISRVLSGPWSQVLEWINSRMSEISRARGEFPGLGSALTALGMKQGMIVAEEMRRLSEPGGDVWSAVGKAIEDPASMSQEFHASVSTTIRRKWGRLNEPMRAERRELLKLLSRFALSVDQLSLIYDPEKRAAARIERTDADFLNNPYLVYHALSRPTAITEIQVNEKGEETKTVKAIPQISFWSADRAILPPPENRKHPLLAHSAMASDDDARRICGLLVSILTKAESEGHSLLPQNLLVERARQMQLNPPVQIDGDAVEALESELEDFLVLIEMSESNGWQLQPRFEMCLPIQGLIRRAAMPAPSLGEIDWQRALEVDAKLGVPHDDRDRAAREEKAAALSVVTSSAFSVLIGPAGTGKTTLLAALCAQEGVRARGILLLAPTGKARVRMTSKIKGVPAKTVASFLSPSGRYEAGTRRYRSNPEGEKTREFKTVVIDESSMLTEDQLSAVLEALEGVERFIMVGDPGQLPPIGVGRPFVDLVKALEPTGFSNANRVGRGYAELVQRMRQANSGEDLQLAELFSGRATRAGDDEIVFALQRSPKHPRLRRVEWNTPDEFRSALTSVLIEEFGVAELSELPGTLGAHKHSSGRWIFPDGCEEGVEAWQVLAPRRWISCGTEVINRLLQEAMRGETLRYAKGKQRPNFRIPKPMGDQQVVVGDKVIALENLGVEAWPRGGLNYVANGEIGFLTGRIYYDPEVRSPWFPKTPQIRFGTQPGYTYSFHASLFGGEGEPPIQLAYAITVHKAQGSEFEKTIVVLPKEAFSMGREIIYTALTRHREKLILMHEGPFSEIVRATSAEHSETARRFTSINARHENPERRPHIVSTKRGGTERPVYLEKYLIHRTRNGTLVSSKSELIIDAELDRAKPRGLRYAYERRLYDSDGRDYRLPDFTIENVNGPEYYWEHCGMLGVKKYADDWESKKAWYAARGVFEWDPVTNPTGRLIVTKDGAAGDADAHIAKGIVDWLIGHLT